MGFSKIIVTVLLLSCIYVTHATTYYFSSTTGNDSNKVNSINSPFRSLNRLNKLKLAYGDIIDFKCGDTWYGSITTNTDGVTYRSYGTGATPVITGFTQIAGWVNVGNGIYRSNAFTVESAVRYVTMDGQQQGQGRYPNANAENAGYLSYEGYGTGFIQDQQLSSTLIDSSWTGATLDFRTEHAHIETGVITALDKSTSKITYDASNVGYFPYSVNYGYFITNSLKTLDQPGEWYYSPKEQCLYMYFGLNNPNSHTVKVTTIDVLFQAHNSFNTLDHIVLAGANKYCIANNWPGKQGLKIQSSIICHAGITCIALNNEKNFLLDNSHVYSANCNGINVGYKCDSTLIRNSVIDHIAMLTANYYRDGSYQGRTGFGIFSAGQDTYGLTVLNTSLTYTGYIGIFFSGSNNRIQDDYIDYTCMHLDDGGGVYCMNAVLSNYTNNIVRHNIIMHTMSQGLGTANPWDHMANGVYCDERTTGMTVEDNFIAFNAQDGIFIHNSNGINVLNNTMAFNGAFAFHLQDGPTLPKVNNILFSGNSMYADGGRQLIYGFYTAGQGIGASGLDRFGVFDRNYIYSPNNITISYVANWSIPYYGFFYSFDQIRSNLPYDNHSILSNAASVYKVLYTNNSTTTFYFKGETYYTIQGVPVRDSIILKARTGIILLKYTG